MSKAGLVAIAIISVVALSGGIGAQDHDHTLMTIEDASGMFNERGWFKSNSFSLDGNEIVNNYNGNLVYSQRLLYLPISQNGLHLDLGISYNGSVGHKFYCGHTPDPDAKINSLNLPEWILAVNNYAVQTFNTEVRWFTWADTTDSTARTDDVAPLINGYHNCYSLGKIDDNEFYGTISILMGDGSIKSYISLNHGVLNQNPTIYGYIFQGEYRTYSKDDKSRALIDSTADGIRLTIFEENGTKVSFLIWRPTWVDTIVMCPGDEIYHEDSLIMFLPTEISDPAGNSIRLSYITAIGPQFTEPYGRPLLRWINSNSWNVEIAYDPSQMLITKNGNQIYEIITGQSVPGHTVHLRHVNSIQDAAGRKTTFEYAYYRLIGERAGDPNGFADICRPGNPYFLQRIAARIDYMCSRLNEIRYPYGGRTFFSYHNDPETRWPGTFTDLQTRTVDYNNWECKINPPAYPCVKCSTFSILGRDDFFINMVSAYRKFEVDGTDTLIFSSDSLIFDWSDNFPTNQISLTDTFFTTRISCKDDFNHDGPDLRRTEFVYKQHEEYGPYSYLERDRGWMIKLHKNITKDSESRIIQQTNYDWGCFTNLCELNAETKVTDNVSTTYHYGYAWADKYVQTNSDLNIDTTIDYWGNIKITYYDTVFRFIENRNSIFLPTLVDSVIVKTEDGVLLSKTSNDYFDNSLTTGFAGQLRESKKYIFEWTAVADSMATNLRDSVIERFEYVGKNSTADRPNGALTKKISPSGDSTVYQYDDCSCVNGHFTLKELESSGTTRTIDTTFWNPGHFWTRKDQFLSNRIFYDSLFAVDTVDTGGNVYVHATAYYGETQEKTDTLSNSHWVKYDLELQPFLCTGAGNEGRVSIRMNGITLRY
ncbi:MAG: hypothetical protein HRF51_01565, partial [bacterium]